MFGFGKKKENAPSSGGVSNVPVSQVLSMKAQGMNNTQIANQLRMSGYSLTQIRDSMAQADIKSAVAPAPGMAPMPAMPGGPMPGPDIGGGVPPMPAMPGGPMQGEPMPTGMEMPPMPGPDMGGGVPGLEPIPPHPLGPQPGELPMQPAAAPEPVQGPPMIPQRQFSPDMLVNELQRIIEEIIEEKWAGVEEKLNVLDAWKAKLETKVGDFEARMAETTARLDEFSLNMKDKGEEFKGTMEDVGTQMGAIEKLMGKLVPSLAEEIKELRSVVEKLKKR